MRDCASQTTSWLWLCLLIGSSSGGCEGTAKQGDTRPALLSTICQRNASVGLGCQCAERNARGSGRVGGAGNGGIECRRGGRWPRWMWPGLDEAEAGKKVMGRVRGKRTEGFNSKAG